MKWLEEVPAATLVHAPGRRVLVSLPSSSAPPEQRLLSLDALRGFAMFWLIGGRELCLALVAWIYPPLADAFEIQVTHPHWEGFVAWDLVMPTFLFLVGTSMPFALAKRCEQGPIVGRNLLADRPPHGGIVDFGHDRPGQPLWNTISAAWNCSATRFKPLPWATWSRPLPCFTCL